MRNWLSVPCVWVNVQLSTVIFYLSDSVYIIVYMERRHDFLLLLFLVVGQQCENNNQDSCTNRHQWNKFQEKENNSIIWVVYMFEICYIEFGKLYSADTIDCRILTNQYYSSNPNKSVSLIHRCWSYFFFIFSTVSFWCFCKLFFWTTNLNHTAYRFTSFLNFMWVMK